MVSVTQAKDIISENITCLPAAKTSLRLAVGLILAEDVFAEADIPAFRQSSMDGYAFSFAGWQQHKKLTITGVVAAGSNHNITLLPTDAVRIFTGAAVPPGADTVVMQEKALADNGLLIIQDGNLEQGMHVRPAGGEIKAGSLALSKESILTPAAIGFLTAIGCTDVLVYPRPSVSIIVTGDELLEPGSPLAFGQVYESNSITLKAALQQLYIQEIKVYRVADDLDSLTATLQQAIQETDMVLLTGGISVGDFDFVFQATVNNGVEKLFHTIKQRPAKPLYFGKKDNTYVFGLPGNPASGLVSFYEYVMPAIGIMSGRSYQLQVLTVPIKQEYKKAAGLTHFLKGWYDGQAVTVLGAQESYRLSSFAAANCLVKVNEESTFCLAGEPVEIHILPS